MSIRAIASPKFAESQLNSAWLRNGQRVASTTTAAKVSVETNGLPTGRVVTPWSLLVLLDHRRRPHVCVVRILTELALGAALPQQVPALIELDLNLLQPDLVVIADVALSVNRLFFVDQLSNLSENGLIAA